MGKVIALFNMSGGVGKSTLTMNLAHHLQAAGKRVLLVDMDPQASLTTFLGLNPFEMESTIYQGLVTQHPPVVMNDILGCSLIPANIYLSHAELELAAVLRREYRLEQVISRVSSQYDLILIDCPPSLGLLSINCLVAANYLVIPIQTEYKSVEATINLLQTTYEIAQQINQELQVIGAVPTMYDERTSQSRRALQTITEVFDQLKGTSTSFKDTIVFPPVPRRTDFANATSEHLPLAVYSPKHPAVETLATIAKTLSDIATA
ncbi:AAA family ATPase [Phormidium sp. FACHB-1136]|uniref:AAA family ATPase n=1 Tax=Phormidium sp. FACHB-1136 TaxID=2692848 RepID=UPI0016848E60|nr:ParA family protein [Phormidium sp. FACHB-1136]